MTIKNKTVWVITEGMIGTENQCLGVCDALNIKPEVFQISLRQPWKTLTPWLGIECSHSFIPKLTSPWPDILITAGRKAIAASRYIKKQSNGQTLTLHLQHPKTNPNQFDLVAAPFHDNLTADNVIVTDGAPNRITPKQLEQAKEKWHPISGNNQKVAVLIGGNSRTHALTQERMYEIIDQLLQIDAHLMITASRRTGEENLEKLKSTIKDTSHFLWDGNGDNPYHAMLGHADSIIVTEDSVSMVSDATTTGKPTYIIPLEGSSKRFDRFHNHMKKIGATKPFDGNLTPYSYEAINDAEKIAKAIQQAL